eukprot:355908-Chlamydomonas_euryale.AAC.14
MMGMRRQWRWLALACSKRRSWSEQAAVVVPADGGRGASRHGWWRQQAVVGLGGRLPWQCVIGWHRCECSARAGRPCRACPQNGQVIL